MFQDLKFGRINLRQINIPLFLQPDQQAHPLPNKWIDGTWCAPGINQNQLEISQGNPHGMESGYLKDCLSPVVSTLPIWAPTIKESHLVELRKPVISKMAPAH